MSAETIIRRECGEAELDAAIRESVEKHGAARDAVIPILSEINAAFGYIPGEALGKIRRQINKPDEGVFLADSHLYSTASFYHMFSLKPLGRHVVRYCASAPCHVVGGREMVAALVERLGIQPGETSPDGSWTFLETSCLGVCAVGPVFQIDDELYSGANPEHIPVILAGFLLKRRGDQ